MASILRIANLCKTYYITNTQKQDVLKGIDLELNEGELVALLGESGCGKSTMINIIGGLDTDYTGSVVIKGKFIRDFSDKEMDEYRKKRIGMIFQNYNLINTMTLFENVEIALQMSDIDKETRTQRTLDLLDIVGLKAHADKHPNQLSGGQKQRVAIARALANNPSIILADEPTGALDKESTGQILEILQKIAQMGKLVIVVTHSSQVADVCTRIVKMDDGLIVDDKELSKPAKLKYEKYVETEVKNITTKEIGKIALRNIWVKRSRNLFVTIGISIGIAALILILALSRGITNYVKDYYAEPVMSTSIMVSRSNNNISASKINEINQISGVSYVTSTYKMSTAAYTYLGNTGTISNLFEEVKNNTPNILYGANLSNDTEMVVDLDYATTLSPEGAIGVIGQSITITCKNISKEYTIVGIYDNDGVSSFITSNAMSEYFSSTKDSNLLYVKVKDVTYLDGVADQIENLGLSATIMDDSSSVLLDYIDLGTTVLVVVAGISTVISAIMIIVVLYVSVIERTEDIGILRSIGSRKQDILKMFMVEAFMIGLIGGALGFGIAYGIAGITDIISYASTKFYFISLNPLYYFIGLFVSVIVSTLAGIAPAKKASSLDPIEALRFE